MSITIHELKQNFKSLLIWSIIIGGMIIVFMMLYPGMKSQIGSIESAYKNMGSFSAAFGMDKISFATALGFYGIEIGSVLAIGGGFFAAIVGISVLSKEEGSHTAEFLLTHPVSRKKIVFEKILYMFIQITLLNIICYVCAISSFAIVGEEVEIKTLAIYHLAVFLLQIELACISFAISAFQKKNNIGLGIGIASLLYFVNLMVNVSDKTKNLKYITPYKYADAADVISSGKIDTTLLAIGGVVSVICIVLSFIKYCKKDIAS